jgi:predicted PurR-regulated permease PerM
LDSVLCFFGFFSKGVVFVNDDRRSILFDTSNDRLVVLAIRLVCLGLLGYWTFILIRPFLTILIWSAIIAVALYPVFDWLSRALRGLRVLAAVLVTACSLLVMLGPAAWLGLSLAETVRALSAGIGDGTIAVPPPPQAIKTWPLVGSEIYQIWEQASTNVRALLVQAAPYLKPFGGKLLAAAGGLGLDMVKFILAIIISGFLFIPGPALVDSTKNVLRHLAEARGEAFVDISGATIRIISRGVIGVAIIQTLLAGTGLIIAGVPGAGLISFLVLILGIVQIGPSIILLPLVVWSWFTMDTTAAIVFSIYMVVVNFVDNILRPLVMAKGLSTPIWLTLIGVLGGTLAHGLIGLFIGPVILSIAWQLIVLWTRNEPVGQVTP